jgi:HEAT repeat protein
VLGNFGCGHHQAVPALAQLTHSPDPNCRIFAARALGQFGTEALPALGTVSNLLSDPDVRVSRQAAQSVEKIRRSHD